MSPVTPDSAAAVQKGSALTKSTLPNDHKSSSVATIQSDPTKET